MYIRIEEKVWIDSRKRVIKFQENSDREDKIMLWK